MKRYRLKKEIMHKGTTILSGTTFHLNNDTGKYYLDSNNLGSGLDGISKIIIETNPGYFEEINETEHTASFPMKVQRACKWCDGGLMITINDKAPYAVLKKVEGMPPGEIK